MRAFKRLFLAIALSLGLAGGAPVAAGPVVVELFTSQGCSSCPPADALLGELAQRDDVIALSLHVDYWDYLGWRDIFGRPEHTRRQSAYSDYVGERSIYTPQMIVNGVDRLVGSQTEAVLASISKALATPDLAEVALRLTDDMIVANIRPLAPIRDRSVVWVVVFDPPRAVRPSRGENKGQRIVYHNVARNWMKFGHWSGQEAVEFRAPIPQGANGVAVFLQQNGVGPIIGAAELRF